MKKLSKGFYLGSLAAGWGLSIILLEMGIILLSLAPVVYSVIVGCLLWYKAWTSIQDGCARTTPGRAIGFLFIPFYNFYWIFQAFWGFAKDYNSYIARHEVAASRLPEGLFLSLCILSLVSGLRGFLARLPLPRYALPIVLFVIGIVVINKLCEAVNTLP